jgi:hypothetical protein
MVNYGSCEDGCACDYCADASSIRKQRDLSLTLKGHKCPFTPMSWRSDNYFLTV